MPLNLPLISRPERSELEYRVGCFDSGTATKLPLKVEKHEYHEYGSYRVKYTYLEAVFMLTMEMVYFMFK